MDAVRKLPETPRILIDTAPPPLIWEHVNPCGRFDLDVNTRLALL